MYCTDIDDGMFPHEIISHGSIMAYMESLKVVYSTTQTSSGRLRLYL